MMPGFAWAAADAFLFDIDGTLLNSRDGVHYWAFHNAIRRHFPVSSKIDDVPVHGNTDIGIIRAVLAREGVPERQVAEQLPLILEQMCTEVADKRSGLRPELCPSVMDLVGSLYSAGKLLGIVSGNLERIGWLKLEAAGLRPYFAFGCFSDQREKREDIFRAGIEEARRRMGQDAVVHFVGDTPSDIMAAQQVGAPIIALATGIFSRDELMRHRPDACFPCCTDLLTAS